MKNAQPTNQAEAQKLMKMMFENELRIHDECFIRTQVEQDELEENLMFYMSDPMVKAKMQAMMELVQKLGGAPGSGF